MISGLYVRQIATERYWQPFSLLKHSTFTASTLVSSLIVLLASSEIPSSLKIIVVVTCSVFTGNHCLPRILAPWESFSAQISLALAHSPSLSKRGKNSCPFNASFAFLVIPEYSMSFVASCFSSTGVRAGLSIAGLASIEADVTQVSLGVEQSCRGRLGRRAAWVDGTC